MIRNQQDEAYQMSLEADRKKVSLQLWFICPLLLDVYVFQSSFCS